MTRSSLIAPTFFAFSLAAALVACSSNTIVHVSANGSGDDDGGVDPNAEGGAGADGSVPITGGDHGPYPAPTGAMPKVQSSGGSVLKSPNIIPVFFPSDALQTQLLDFLTKISTSQFLAANVGEYGVGAATVGTPIMMSTNPPTSLNSSTMGTYVATNVVPKYPAADANTLFVVFIPASTKVDLGQGSSTCTDVGGYHESTSGGKQVAYAIVPRCQSFVNQQPHLSTLLEVTTSSATHEIVEAMTDPFPLSPSTAAYNTLDDDHLLWQYVLGGAEIGDMCAQFPDSFGANAELGYSVQRSWSNKAAASGHNPCVPQATGEVYFNAIYNPTDAVDVGGGQTTKALALTVGQARTVDVTLVSDAPMNAFKVAGVSLNPGVVTVKFDKAGGYNGDKLKMTVTLNQTPQQMLAPFFIVSTYGQQQQIWPVAVIAQ